MPTINQLPLLSPISSGDQLPVYSPNNGDARRTSIGSLLTFFQQSFASPTLSVNLFVPGSGFNITVPTPVSNDQWMLLQPAGTLASGTITLPLNTGVPDGTTVLITTTQEITSLTIALNGASAIFGGVTSLAAGTATAIRFYQPTNSWYQINAETVYAAGIQAFLANPTSANLRTAMTDETGTGVLVFNTSPALVSPSYTGTLTGGTGVINIGSGQFVKDASGNVGIGLSNPLKKFVVSEIGVDFATSVGGGVQFVGTTTNNSMAFITNEIERGQFDTSGNFLVGKTALPSASVFGFAVNNSTNNFPYLMNSINTTGAGTHFEFYNPNGNIGSITTTGSATAYVTSSDYRLKENVAPMTGALATVAALKPVTYTWKADGSDGQGFIAHELQAVVPDSVTGTKDGMRTEQYEISPAIPAIIDEDGEIIEAAVEAVMGEREVPNYQGVDTSFLVATLVAAIQELKADFDAYKVAHP